MYVYNIMIMICSIYDNIIIMCLLYPQNIPGAYANRCITVTPPSPGLVIHVHGGGFVSQSVKSHEVR